MPQSVAGAAARHRPGGAPRRDGRARALGVAGLLVAALAVFLLAAFPPAGSAAGPLVSAEPVRGVTLETIEELDDSARLLSESSAELTVRLVMGFEHSLDEYRRAVEALDPHAALMVQLADSEELAGLSREQLLARTQQAMDAFGDRVELWEVGNELNGAWAGSSPAQIDDKVEGAYELVRARGGRTVITLNYWSGPECRQEPWEDPLAYARGMPERLRGVDALLLSVYETACDPPQRPGAAELAASLRELGELFPRAMLGIGEIGAQGREDGLPEDPAPGEKARIAEYYYGMHAELSEAVGPRYIGGYFWWYFKRDAVDPEAAGGAGSLWPLLDELTAGL
ncbi:MAG: hypothetical protein Q4E05_08960 [Pseudoclavibacter sp.]|nr:hypothetical protein [Pseudoclavibacter sp.]